MKKILLFILPMLIISCKSNKVIETHQTIEASKDSVAKETTIVESRGEKDSTSTSKTNVEETVTNYVFNDSTGTWKPTTKTVTTTKSTNEQKCSTKNNDYTAKIDTFSCKVDTLYKSDEIVAKKRHKEPSTGTKTIAWLCCISILVLSGCYLVHKFK